MDITAERRDLAAAFRWAARFGLNESHVYAFDGDKYVFTAFMADKLKHSLEVLADDLLVRLRREFKIERIGQPQDVAEFEGYQPILELLRQPSPQVQLIIQEAERDFGDRDQGAMQAVERLLANLEGETITEESVRLLKAFLKRRGWGLRCPRCDEPAAPLWKPDATCSEGGRMQFLHSNAQGTSIHASRTVFERLRLTERPDRRRKEHRAAGATV